MLSTAHDWYEPIRVLKVCLKFKSSNWNKQRGKGIKKLMNNDTAKNILIFICKGLSIFLMGISLYYISFEMFDIAKSLTEKVAETDLIENTDLIAQAAQAEYAGIITRIISILFLTIGFVISFLGIPCLNKFAVFIEKRELLIMQWVYIFSFTEYFYYVVKFINFKLNGLLIIMGLYILIIISLETWVIVKTKIMSKVSALMQSAMFISTCVLTLVIIGENRISTIVLSAIGIILLFFAVYKYEKDNKYTTSLLYLLVEGRNKSKMKRILKNTESSNTLSHKH